MSLTGLPFVVTTWLVAGALIVGTLLGWARLERHGAWRAALARLVCLAMIMISGALVTFATVNRDYQFYASFGEVFGGAPAAPPDRTATDPPRTLDPAAITAGRNAAARGHGLLLPYRFPGRTSRIVRTGYLYLPATYFDPARARVRYPVLELFSGFPGNPANWVHQLHIGSVLDRRMAAGSMQPTVVVIPDINGGSHDTECLDRGRTQRNETYLAVDVPEVVDSIVRVAPGRSWATLGYSTGGYCAANVAMHHADRYAAAASLAGYFAGPVSRPRPVDPKALDSPLWWVGHHPTSVALYLTCSRGDPGSVLEARRMERAAGRDHVTTVLLPTGGHNFAVWSAMLPPALDWVTRTLPTPLAPAAPGGAGIPAGPKT